jgi:hypothetical protein
MLHYTAYIVYEWPFQISFGCRCLHSEAGAREPHAPDAHSKRLTLPVLLSGDGTLKRVEGPRGGAVLLGLGEVRRMGRAGRV